MKYFLDSNICIYLINRKSEKLMDAFEQFPPEEIVVSAIVLSELELGVSKSDRVEQNRQRLREFLEPFQIVPYPVSAAKIYGDIRAELEKKGTPIGGNDLLIAAHTLAEDVTLVTNNDREFLRVPNLKVENWVN